MKTLLVVEDDADIFDYYRILFGGLDVRLLRAATGREGLAVVDAGAAIDLILLDMVLPEMGGEEFFRAVRLERGVATPVVACSVDESLIEPLWRVGPLQGVFLKGNPGSTLVALVRERLGL
ncbi:MAG TPA: response regulator [Candidatus Methanoperedens sp.]|nr:response regulator [Candidatus Methanoperedens sp.]